ncbi:hypothetical protein PanWU01x14_185850 [Parasponia andersonii]|uniref:DUF4283 domain-containing protein n=1 Tax=Parasponia andersonii TaxID=3476 RepID=A0A2P5C416_PARAD|nr:hypothetical protein PanWU01x14_185850 [Parasponia andersonii]
MGSPNIDLDEISKLCQSLNLDEVEMTSSAYSENKDKLDLCLVGKIIGNKLANRDGLESAMENISKIPGNFKIEQISSNNIFLFEFRHKEDRLRVLAGGP